jgi:hypothetical protein
MRYITLGIFLLWGISANAQEMQKYKFSAVVTNNEQAQKEFTYVVPGYAYSSFTSNVVWTGQGETGYGVKTSGGTIATPASTHSYTVRGATLSLQLPDGRIAVVNCAQKVNWTEWNTHTYRSCRIPPVGIKLQLEFQGTAATLKWEWEEKKVVSLDRAVIKKHKEHETYTLIDVLVPAKKEGEK